LLEHLLAMMTGRVLLAIPAFTWAGMPAGMIIRSPARSA
jgi:hypothetical protein